MEHRTLYGKIQVWEHDTQCQSFITAFQRHMRRFQKVQEKTENLSQHGVSLAKWQGHSGWISNKYCLSSQASQKLFCNHMILSSLLRPWDNGWCMVFPEGLSIAYGHVCWSQNIYQESCPSCKIRKYFSSCFYFFVILDHLSLKLLVLNQTFNKRTWIATPAERIRLPWRLSQNNTRPRCFSCDFFFQISTKKKEGKK